MIGKTFKKNFCKNFEKKIFILNFFSENFRFFFGSQNEAKTKITSLVAYT